MLTQKERAKAIARSMNARGLQPWHIPNELEVQAIPLFEREELAKLVAKELEKLQCY